MRVYRVENAETVGPYGADGPLWQFREDKSSPLRRSAKHPSIFPDGHPFNLLMSIGAFRDMGFGFETKAQALEWFSLVKWRKAMALAGFSLVTFETKGEVIKGEGQLMFQRGSATIIESEPLWTPKSP